MNSERVPAQPGGTIWRELSDGIVLVSPDKGVVRVLNGVGAQVWRLMDGKRTVAGIRSALLEQYDVSGERVNSDLESFLADLENRGLLEWKQAR